MTANPQRRSASNNDKPTKAKYNPPEIWNTIPLTDLLIQAGRAELEPRQMALLKSPSRENGDPGVFYAGDLDLLRRPAVSIVGTRDVSDAGWARATRLAKELVEAGFTIVSGLARGIDTAAMTGALDAGGHVVGVIGTPLDKASPVKNAPLQERVWRDHLLISPFEHGSRVFKANFPKRNRVMAAITDATVIVEASDTSGTLHQAAECQRLGRWLFIMKSTAENPELTWPASFLGKPKASVLESTDDILAAIGR